jgi:hypothetical protein
MGSNQNAGKSATHRAPLRELCAMLCLLPKTADPHIDFAEADPELLLALASQLVLTLDCLHQGIAGLGALLADLGRVLLYINALSNACRCHLDDYAP